MLRKKLPILVGFYFIFACSTEPNEHHQNASLIQYQYDTEEYDLINRINDYRVLNGLNELETVEHISGLSEQHNFYMISTNNVSHYNYTLRVQNLQKNIGAKSVSENLAYKYNTVNAVFNAWISSELHHENILGNYTHFGLSIRKDSLNRNYYTTIFVKK